MPFNFFIPSIPRVYSHSPNMTVNNIQNTILQGKRIIFETPNTLQIPV